jgi:hypothetical protein
MQQTVDGDPGDQPNTERIAISIQTWIILLAGLVRRAAGLEPSVRLAAAARLSGATNQSL